jgi:hypothetical protein
VRDDHARAILRRLGFRIYFAESGRYAGGYVAVRDHSGLTLSGTELVDVVKKAAELRRGS